MLEDSIEVQNDLGGLEKNSLNTWNNKSNKLYSKNLFRKSLTNQTSTKYYLVSELRACPDM